MVERSLYSIQEARKLLGGISRNTIYHLLRSGQLASVVIGCRRFVSDDAIAELIERATTTVSPSRASTRPFLAPKQGAAVLSSEDSPRQRRRVHS